MAVVSVAVVVTSAALFALIYVHSSHFVAVVAVVRQIPQGQTVEVADLRQVDVTLANGVDMVPVSDASEVIGRRAAVTLLAGTLLSPSDVGGAQQLPENQAIVGVDVKPGMMPATGVEAGETVLVILTSPAGTGISAGTDSGSSTSGTSNSSRSGQSADGGQTPPDVIATATVVGVDDSPDDGGSGDIVVSVDVQLSLAPLVADASAAGQAALVQVGGAS